MKRPFPASRPIFRPLTIAILAITLICCEDVIDVDLDRATPRLVIEGYLSNHASRNFFAISRTTDFYGKNEVEPVSDAVIVVTDSAGATDTLRESVAGRYLFSRPYSPQSRVTYYASVLVEGTTYTASTTMAERITIDSLRAEYQEGGGVGTEEDEGYRLHVFFRDTATVSDYARIKLFKGDTTLLDYYLYDGRYSDGNVIDYEYFFDVYQPGEAATAELWAMDRTMYYYFLTLAEVWASEEGGSSFDATPANPNTNWDGDALGYFGAFNVDIQTMVIPED